MKFIVDCQEFKNLMGTCSRGLIKQPNAKAVVEIIGTETAPRLKVSCQTGASFFEGSIAIQSVEGYERKVWGLEYDKIKSVLAVLPSISTTLTFVSPDEDGQTLELHYLGNNINVKFYQDVQVPSIVGEKVELGKIESADFFKMMSSMLKIVENNQQSRDIATGCLHISLSNNKIKTMATNRYAIAEMTVDFDQEPNTNFETMKMIKLEQGNLLLKSAVAGEILTLLQVGNMFGYIDGNNILNLVALADIRPIEYRQIVNSASDEIFTTISADSLKETFTNIGKLNPVEEEVKICVENGYITTKTQLDSLELSPTVAPEDSDIVLSNVEENIELCFNRPTTTDIFGLLNTNDVRLSWAKDGTMVKFTVLSKELIPVDNLFIGVVIHG